MSERNFLLYRLDVVRGWPESDYKATVIAAINHRLARLPNIPG